MIFIFYGLQADKVTPSGNLYKREVLEKAIEDCKEQIPLSLDAPKGGISVDVKNIIGHVEDIKLEDDGYVIGNVKIYDKVCEKLVQEGDAKIASFGVGKVMQSNADCKLIKDYQLLGAFLSVGDEK